MTKRFPDGERDHAVLRGVDLDVAPGELVAIVGPSGSGKSTLLYVAGALDRDFEGEAVVAGTPLGGLDDAARADLRNRAVGFVFQSFNLLPALSALENVMLPGVLRPGGARLASVRARARDALEQVGLAGRMTAPPARLSGGERQRVGDRPRALRRARGAPRGRAHRQPRHRGGEDVIRLFVQLAGRGCRCSS